MDWQVSYLDTIQNWLDNLTKQQIISLAKEIRLLELCGNCLKLPHSKSLGSGLFELRERRYGLRVYYGFSQKKDIVLLHAGDKKTQKKDMKKARELLNLLKEIDDEN